MAEPQVSCSVVLLVTRHSGGLTLGGGSLLGLRYPGLGDSLGGDRLLHNTIQHRAIKTTKNML